MDKVKSYEKMRLVYLKSKLKLIKWSIILIQYTLKKEKLEKKIFKLLKKSSFKLADLYIDLDGERSDDIYKLSLAVSNLIFIDDEILTLFIHKLLNDDVVCPLFLFLNEDYYNLVKEKFDKITDFDRVYRDLNLFKEENFISIKEKYINFMKEIIL